MFKRSLFLLFLFISALIIFVNSCSNDLVIPTPCTESLDIQFSKVYISFVIDGLKTYDTVNIDKQGFANGDNIKIKSKSLLKTAKINGYICKSKFGINVIYTDSVDNSRLFMDGTLVNNFIGIKLLYCKNENGNCNFVQIGTANGYISLFKGWMVFNTPLFKGDLDFWTGS